MQGGGPVVVLIVHVCPGVDQQPGGIGIADESRCDQGGGRPGGLHLVQVAAGLDVLSEGVKITCNDNGVDACFGNGCGGWRLFRLFPEEYPGWMYNMQGGDRKAQREKLGVKG